MHNTTSLHSTAPMKEKMLQLLPTDLHDIGSLARLRLPGTLLKGALNRPHHGKDRDR